MHFRVQLLSPFQHLEMFQHLEIGVVRVSELGSRKHCLNSSHPPWAEVLEGADPGAEAALPRPEKVRLVHRQVQLHEQQGPGTLAWGEGE